MYLVHLSFRDEDGIWTDLHYYISREVRRRMRRTICRFQDECRCKRGSRCRVCRANVVLKGNLFYQTAVLVHGSLSGMFQKPLITLEQLTQLLEEIEQTE